MKEPDYTKLFDVGENISLSSDFLDRYYSPDSWEQDCINVQKKQGSLKIIEVGPTGVYVAGTKINWYLGIYNINLYQLEPYKENPEILYAFADNQAKQGKKRNVSFPLIMAFDWKFTPEGYDFWRKINNNIDNNNSKSKKPIETLKENQQETIQNNNYEIRLQKQKAIVIRGTRPKGSRVCSSKHKASIRSGQISYTACHC